MSKKERRLQKVLTKLEKQKTKNARLSSSVVIHDKRITLHHKPDLVKSPRSADPDNYKQYAFSWCHTQSDVNGEWTWGEPRKWTEEEFNNTIEPHFNSHGADSWSDVESKTYSGRHKARKKLNKYQPLCSLCNEAQSRWLDLDLICQFDELFRFRLGTDKRAWGIRIKNHFYMVWYERDHNICPFKK